MPQGPSRLSPSPRTDACIIRESSNRRTHMKASQHTAEQIIKILQQAEKGHQTIGAVCRTNGIAENTFYRWRKTYGGMSVNEPQCLKVLEKENTRLKRLLAERMLEVDALKELLGKQASVSRNNGRRCASW